MYQRTEYNEKSNMIKIWFVFYYKINSNTWTEYEIFQTGIQMKKKEKPYT